MWPSDETSPSTEDRIAAAARLPALTEGFRARVLHQSYRAQSQSISLQRIQTLTTSLLALALLVCLPGYYRSLRDPLAGRHAVTTWEASTSRVLPPAPLPPGVRPNDYDEWRFVESALAARDLSARSLLGTL